MTGPVPPAAELRQHRAAPRPRSFPAGPHRALLPPAPKHVTHLPVPSLTELSLLGSPARHLQVPALKLPEHPEEGTGRVSSRKICLAEANPCSINNQRHMFILHPIHNTINIYFK